VGGDHPDRLRSEIEPAGGELVHLGGGFQRTSLVDRHDLGEERSETGVAQLLPDHRERIVR
jgi:hypothetical protein